MIEDIQSKIEFAEKRAIETAEHYVKDISNINWSNLSSLLNDHAKLEVFTSIKNILEHFPNAEKANEALRNRAETAIRSGYNTSTNQCSNLIDTFKAEIWFSEVIDTWGIFSPERIEIYYNKKALDKDVENG